MATEEAVIVVKVKDNASPQLRAVVDAQGKLRDERGRFIKQSGAMQGAMGREAMSARKLGGALGGMSTQTIAASAASMGLSAASAALSMALDVTVDSAIASVKAFAEFEASLTRAGAVTSDSAGRLGEMKQAAVEAGLATTFSANDAAQAMTMLGMAGFNASEQIASVKPVLDLANVGNLELARTAEIASNVLTAYGFQATELGSINDKLAKTFTSTNTTLATLGKSFEFVGPVAKATGQDFDGLLAQLGTLGNLGIQASKAGTGIRAALSSLAKPSTEGAAVLKDLGISTRTATGQMRQLTDIIADLAERGATTTDILSIFGKIGGTAVQALVSNVDDIRKLTTEIKGSTGAAKEMADTINASLDAQARILQGTVETLGIQIGAQFKDALVDTTQALTQQAQALAKDEELMRDMKGTSRDLQQVFAQLLRGSADLVVAFGHLGGAALEVGKRTESMSGAMRKYLVTVMPLARAAKMWNDHREANKAANGELDKSESAYGRAVRGATKLADSMRKVADATDPTKNSIRNLRKELTALGKDAVARGGAMIRMAGASFGKLWDQITKTGDAYNFTAKEVREYNQAQERAAKTNAKRIRQIQAERDRLAESLALKRADIKVLRAAGDETKARAEYERELTRIEFAKGEAQEKALMRTKASIELEQKLSAIREQEAQRATKLSDQLALEKARQQVLSAQTDEARIQSEYDLKILQAKIATRNVEDETLQKSQLVTAELAARRDQLRALEDLEKERRKERERAEKKQKKAAEERDRALRSAAAQWNMLGDTGSAVMRDLGAGLEQLTVLGADLGKVMSNTAMTTKEAGAASAAALGTAGKATSSFAAAMGASAAEQAAILALFETASAVASFATGNIPAGIQHGIAAATYGAVAAMGGQGGAATAPTGGGGGGGVSSGGGGGVDMEGVQQRSAEILADALADSLGGGGGATIVYDMRGTLVTQSLFDEVNRDARSQGIDLRDQGRRSR